MDPRAPEMEPTDLTEDETTLLLFLDANSMEPLPVHEVVARANIDEHLWSLAIDTLCRNDLIDRDKRGRLIIKVPGERMAIQIREARAAAPSRSRAARAKDRLESLPVIGDLVGISQGIGHLIGLIGGIIGAIGGSLAIAAWFRGC